MRPDVIPDTMWCVIHAVQVNNVIDPFKYTEVPFGSKTELKDYLKVSTDYATV